MYIRSVYFNHTMSIDAFDDLYTSVRVSLHYACRLSKNIWLKELYEFARSDEFFVIINDNFIGNSNVLIEDSKSGVKMEVHANNNDKLVNIYSDDKAHPFFIQIKNNVDLHN